MTRTCPCGQPFTVAGNWSRRKHCDDCVHARRVEGGRYGQKRRADKLGPAPLVRTCAECLTRFPIRSLRDGPHLCADCRQRARAVDDRGVYMPTPEQIRAACLELQATWTEADFIRRAGAGRALPVEFDILCQ